jgi:uncharacterized surface protein with fasciclin (FAS1) repeats
MSLLSAALVRPRALAAAALLLAAAVVSPSHAAAQDAPKKPILEVVSALGEYSLFLEALKATGLADKIAAGGTWTVYAPNDAAFARLNPDTLAALKADKDRLTRVLSHHVMPTKYTGMDMMNAPIYSKVPTFAGDSMVIYHDKGGIKVDYKLVKVVDIEATDGVIHTVREIILKP